MFTQKQSNALRTHIVLLHKIFSHTDCPRDLDVQILSSHDITNVSVAAPSVTHLARGATISESA
jgi:hypothetical protein